MNKFLEFIEKVDIFGVQIVLLTNNKESSFQSRIGGLISLVLGSLSFAYTLYILVLWTENKIPPNINTKQETTGYSEFQWSEPLIFFTLSDFTSSIDPFRNQNNIITPLLYTLRNGMIKENPIALFSDSLQPNSIIISNGTLILNNGDQDEHTEEMQEYLLVFAQCSKEYLQADGYCADDTTIEEYTSIYHGFIDITIRLNQLNYQSNQLETFQKTYYQAFDPKRPLYTQVMLKQQETIIDDGILFTNQKSQQFLNNYEIINQEVDNRFIPHAIESMSQNPFTLDISSTFLFRIDNISIVEEVSMPKLGSILAQIGSIVDIIFLMQYVAFYYNNKLLENGLFHDIVTMYYPEFKNFKPNIINKFQINDEINQSQITTQILQQKYQTLLKGAKEKCRLNNILYEISRIQLILEQQFGQSVLQSSHSLGRKITKDQLEQVCDSLYESNCLVVKPVDSSNQEIKQSIDEPLTILIKPS
ncbi:unnamed protein product [Paramecium octaurelia]|uniref:Uncharacterized protein n=1 Tax=Paramecium octaurelia TaxID=43137 RepID=A0A8S1WS39_PAROT|nr:unnamed protein product [Paramecium octaurelia]